MVSGLSVIILEKDRRYGILGAHTTKPRDFSKDDVNFITSIANLLAVTIERKLAEEHLAYQSNLLAGIDELAFENNGIRTDKLNFSTDNNSMLNALAMDITNHHWRYPPIKGLTRQMGTYTLEADKKGHPQDIVMTLAELSHLIRFLPAEPDQNSRPEKANYRNRRQRTTAVRRRR